MSTQATTTPAPAKKYNDMTYYEKAQYNLDKLAAEYEAKKVRLNTELAKRAEILAAVGEKMQPAVYHDGGHKDGTTAGFTFQLANYGTEYTAAADIEQLLVAFPPLPAVIAQCPNYAPHYAAASHAATLVADNFKCVAIGDITVTIEPNGFGSYLPKARFKYYTMLAGEVHYFDLEVNLGTSKIGRVYSHAGRADTYESPRFEGMSGTSSRQGYWGNTPDERRRLPNFYVHFTESAAADFTPADWAQIMLPTPSPRS